MATLASTKEIKQLYKKTHTTISLFNIPLHFTQDYEEFITLLSPLNIPTPENCDGLCVYGSDEKGLIIFYIGVFDNKISTLAHESTHCALNVMGIIGQKLDYEDELLPYLIQDIFEKCYCKFNLESV